MATYIPVNLAGDNLGQRHRSLNALVTKAHDEVSFMDIENVSCHSPLDRLFKIDLASRFKNVEYIVRSLKDDDMLYVSRALKATWLLDPEYKDIINPKHLEDTLFPEMVSPGVTKMIHWLYINLREPVRCLEFYEHYKEKKTSTALKFLAKCTSKIISNEFPKILPKITPHYLKVFCEKCPKFAKLYFEELGTEKNMTVRYQENIQAYHNSVMCVLKSEPEVFFNILEKYHTLDLKKLSPAATKHIIHNHKDKFSAKPELYTVWLLHIPTLSNELNAQESEDLVLTLARAKFLDSWFSYKNVEPLVKRLSPDRRAAFKKRVFVDKHIGARVVEWPYPLPQTPHFPESYWHTFDDPDDFLPKKKKIMKRTCKSKYGRKIVSTNVKKTELDRLFEQYRVVGFEGTFHELSLRLRAAGTADSRRNIFLVLVSKTGGREESVSKLLQLMTRHINEPANFRATIVRSLMKRANVWRLPADAWASLLKFSNGLGLDGSPAEANCREGLHAFVLRQLLSDSEIAPDLRVAFFSDFTIFSEYSLTADERTCIVASLTRLLLNSAETSEPEEAAEHLEHLIRVLKAHRIKIDGQSPVVTAAKALAKRQPDAARDILSLLYDACVARKELFVENLELRRNDAAYINLLRHDPTVLDPTRLIETLVKDKEPLNRFICKLNLYFSESEGLAARVLYALQQSIANEPDVMLARPLVTLIGRDLISFMRNFDKSKEDDVIKRRLSFAIRACAHHARPKLDMDKMEMSEIGVKAVVIRAMVCRGIDTEKYINKLLTSRRTVKTALLLAEKNETEPLVFSAAASLRPIAVIKATLRYFRRSNDHADTTVWNIIKPLILTLDLTDRRILCRTLNCIQSIPSTIRADYCATMYNLFGKLSINYAVTTLHSDFQNLLPDMNVQCIDNILLTMLSRNEEDELSMLYPNFFVKYLLLCKTKEEQTRRFEVIGQRFLDRIVFLFKNLSESEHVRREFLIRTLKCLKYNRVFYDTQYVNCEPVFERVVAWMQINFKMEDHFPLYAELHLTMLYYRAVRKSIEVASEVFSEQERKMNEGVDIVGVMFGKFIARELNELTSRYFTSITQFYEEPFNKYLNDFLYGPSRKQFTAAVLKGILEEEVRVAPRLVICFLKEHSGVLSNAKNEELISIIKTKDTETQFFLYAELFG